MPDTMKSDYMLIIIQICEIYIYFKTFTKVEYKMGLIHDLLFLVHPFVCLTVCLYVPRSLSLVCLSIYMFRLVL